MEKSPLQTFVRNARSLIWRAAWLLLVLGVAAGALRLRFPAPGADSWEARWLGIGLWAGVWAACALALRAVSRAPDLLRALAAMWRPLALVVAAAYLLFSNDQGRELGVSLLAENNNLRLFFLFVALIYWAANNWHTARLGLRAAIGRGEIPSPSGDEKWLFWPPRLLGVCAHLFAAINLSLAAAAVGLGWMAWTAPVAIVLATALAWILDRFLLSERTSLERTLLTKIGAVAVALLLLGAIAAVAFAVPNAPAGFSAATIWISASAIVFLVVISLLRRRRPLAADATPAEKEADNRREGREIFAFTAGLFGVAVVFAFATWLDPVAVGGFFGSMVVAYFAIGAALALVNAIEFAVTWTTEMGFWGEGARPRVIGAYVAAFVVGFGILNAWLHPFHRVRPCDGDCRLPAAAAGFATMKSPGDRPTVAAAARAWYEQAKAAHAKAGGEGPVPMLIVVTAGGGIRAAYWTAEVLEKLASDFENEEGFKAAGGVRPYLFAISGVSGGSVGAAAFDAALAERDETGCKAGGDSCPHATGFLTADFLAPALASLVFVDTPSSFLPDFRQSDRGAALERSFEKASGGLLARPFLSLFPYKKDPAAAGKAPWRPILLLNATHEETGKRIIAAHVLIERNVFIDSLDALNVLGGDVRASTAAHNSARFTYVSPAGDLGGNHGSVIDGGYYENYGALTALELARAARWELRNEKQPAVKLVILMISSDPSLGRAHELVRIKKAADGGQCLVSVAEREDGQGKAPDSQKPDGSPNYLSLDDNEVENAWINEFIAPLQGIKNVREAHGNRAAAELAVQICSEYPDAPKTDGASSPSPAAQASPQLQTAGTLDKSKDESVDRSSRVQATRERPYFAHLAMCKDGTPAPVQAPLGWVLSKATQKAFPQLLQECENDRELEQLEIALGKTERPQPVAEQTTK